jgi:upstream activation factor subunit UAF30
LLLYLAARRESASPTFAPFKSPGEAMATKKKAKKKAAGKKRTAKKSSAKKSGKKKGGTKRVPSAAFMKPMTPSAQLATVVGSSPLPRTEVTKKLWAYIRRKGLQDSKNRRMINADDNLRPVFNGAKQVSMFEMTRLVNKHLK